MRILILRDRFDRMAKRMAEIEMRAFAFLELIRLDHTGFDRHIVGDEFGEIIQIE